MKTFIEALQAFRQEKNRLRIAIYKNEQASNDALYTQLKDFFDQQQYCAEIVDTFFYIPTKRSIKTILIFWSFLNCIPCCRRISAG
ncbi:hypothetical protein FACS1894130_02460 [Spirochaetia bacterium]|nr:hypothetical protein FACS1894130_02460 [Spirochaetia bacterium]